MSESVNEDSKKAVKAVILFQSLSNRTKAIDRLRRRGIRDAQKEKIVENIKSLLEE